MTNKELNAVISNHLKNIENSLNKIKEVSRKEGTTTLVTKTLDAEEYISKLYKEIER